ncbi:hypothetical protein LOOC260_114490 [Paucilactobacillus hokkaidonensis JCM 18461]|uniref:Uncharacterized protein n=4 Tax=Paucilactobacillus hokkaidonensis TaxID=1193095 RepID=A0A0A1GVG7_9LACO|nr:hypothetical protein [Paucilactobacillus hokkaidonensis]KRO06523.1 hypothetical protein IV59_GL002009 [Paucilactobacillus hokkaidonensis]BAP85495.1 hypothetical protein LOOC260_109560 [Paucilactobacillus hokkaidonensis JCM 18461]BAP85985.1 hypothetical protein LOOC260_114490 [Paucilactobacillus hokkaidonensis JCM 18461]
MNLRKAQLMGYLVYRINRMGSQDTKDFKLIFELNNQQIDFDFFKFSSKRIAKFELSYGEIDESLLEFDQGKSFAMSKLPRNTFSTLLKTGEFLQPSSVISALQSHPEVLFNELMDFVNSFEFDDTKAFGNLIYNVSGYRTNEEALPFIAIYDSDDLKPISLVLKS